MVDTTQGTGPGTRPALLGRLAWEVLMRDEMIERCGFVITQSQRGAYWDLAFFVRFDGHSGMRDVHYWNLSKTEIIDVILANVDDYTPGTVRMNGGDQRSLWSEPDDAA